MKNNKNTLVAYMLLITLVLSSCTSTTNTTTTSTTNTTTQTQETVSDNDIDSTTVNSEEDVELEVKDLDLKTTSLEEETITLNGSSISYSWDNATVSWSNITIKKAWNYKITWTLDDGQIIIDSDDDDAVQLILAGVEITNSESSAIYVSNAKQTIINLESGTTNTLTDASEYVFLEEEDEPKCNFIFKRWINNYVRMKISSKC